MTRQFFIDWVRQEVSGGLPSDDIGIDDSEIWGHASLQIARLATSLARGAYAVDGVHEVYEGLLIRYVYTSLGTDSATGDKEVVLPAPPVALPLGYSVTSVFITGEDDMPREITALKEKRLTFYMELPRIRGGFGYYHVVGDKVRLRDVYWRAGINKLLITVNGGEPGQGSGEINLPADLMADVFAATVKLLRERMRTPIDNNNDGQDIKT